MTGSDVRRLCLSLPGTTEKETWGDAGNPGHPTFRVRDKIYLIMAHDGSGGTIRTSRDEQADLMAAFPDAVRSAAYVGRFGWIDVTFADLDEPILTDVIKHAWARTAPRKIADAYASGSA
jgi:predicted DNA-binding protein (MmcQ/YjbR family)